MRAAQVKAKAPGLDEYSQDQRAAIWQRWRTDFRFFAETCLFIRIVVPSGEEPWVPFIVNAEQDTLVSWFEQCDRAGVPIRVLILKARKLGFSTLVLAWMLWKCAFNSSWRAVCVAHLEESAREIALIAHGFNERLPGPVADRIGASAKGSGLIWGDTLTGSRIRVMTARSDDVARGGSPQWLHLSEAAAYDARRAKTSAEDFLDAALGSVDEVAGTGIVMETTSRGAWGVFFDYWNLSDGPDSMWKRFFFDWQSSEKYRFPVAPKDAAMDAAMRAAYDAGDGVLARSIAAELGYRGPWYMRAIDYGLTPPQVAWAQRICDGKFKGDLARFDREYPVAWQVAFIAAGRTVFPRALLDAWREMPFHEGTQTGARLVKGAGGWPRLVDGSAEWEMYEAPVKGHEYTVGVDVASGSADVQSVNGIEVSKGDYSCISVYDRHTGRQVAEFYSQLATPEETGEQMALAAVLYGHAFILPEREAHGERAIKTSLAKGYSRMWRTDGGREVRPGRHYSDRFGLRTTAENRTPLVDGLVAAARAGTFKPRSKRFAHEADTFIYDRNDRPDHAKGRHSDALFAAALAIRAHESLPGVSPVHDDIERPFDPNTEAIAKFKERMKTRAIAARKPGRATHHLIERAAP